MKDKRPNPEVLLQQIQEEERDEKQGKLKIYLGAAPGVGKTYTMLQDALSKRTSGLDVIIGVIETHGREEIKSLLNSFETVKNQQVDYHGKELNEFNLDEALKRNPGLILMDEMAHTNVPGLRHAKRWQDIKELLDRGIDVYTTLNVQHIESLNDIVSQIIHIRIKETVPDSMIEMANTIELVDLPPEELLKRLQDGKVYFPGQVELAKENFFRKGNLIALRELALRTTAERVGEQVLLYRQGQGIHYIWPTEEKLLVCVGSKPWATKIIRAARRMASGLQAKWIAVHVNDIRFDITEEENNQAIKNLRFAEKLGAETKIVTGTNIVTEVINFAREQNISKIMIGKHSRPWWKTLFFSNKSDSLIHHSGEIDIYSITGDSTTYTTHKISSSKRKIPWKIYLFAIGIVGFSTLVDFFLEPYLDTSNLIMIYLIGVITVALFGRIGPSFFASLLTILAYDFFFTPPYFSLSITDPQYYFTLSVLLIVTQFISYLTLLTRREATAAHVAEQHTARLHTLSRQLASTRGTDKLLDIAARYLSDIFSSEVIALLPENGHLKIRARYRTTLSLNEKEQSIAQWVYELGQTAGLGTDTLPFSDAIYLPLIALQGTIGVLRIQPTNPKQLLSPEQMHLLEACANQIALAIEVDRLQMQKKRSEFQTESDRINSSLLQSVSHDLRTPLVAVMGAASTLVEMGGDLDTRKIKKLGKEIYVESEQIKRLINNLLQINYLESNTIKLQIKPNSIEDPLNIVIKSYHNRLEKNSILVHIPPEIPKFPFDSTLIQEVLSNLIDNALKFTRPDSPIDITAKVIDDHIEISVEDRGPGIVSDEVNKLFEKYYRGRMLTTERGLGLGLAICQRIILAHGGKIWAENREGGGAAFRFTLPR